MYATFNVLDTSNKFVHLKTITHPRNVTNKLQRHLKTEQSPKNDTAIGVDVPQPKPNLSTNVAPFSKMSQRHEVKKLDLQMAIGDEEKFKTLCNEILVQYWITGHSRYSPHKFFCHEARKKEVYSHCDINQIANRPHSDEQNFNPTVYGYNISKIEVN